MTFRITLTYNHMIREQSLQLHVCAWPCIHAHTQKHTTHTYIHTHTTHMHTHTHTVIPSNNTDTINRQHSSNPTPTHELDPLPAWWVGWPASGWRSDACGIFHRCASSQWRSRLRRPSTGCRLSSRRPGRSPAACDPGPVPWSSGPQRSSRSQTEIKAGHLLSTAVVEQNHHTHACAALCLWWGSTV